MTNKIQCETHGEREETFVCIHVTGDAAGLGFNREEPSEEKPFPYAWCDDCELIFEAHDGWNDESSKLTEIVFFCSGCYERARIRNTHTTVTLDDLADLRWKCGSCEEWHTSPCLDFSYAEPYYWSQEYEKVNAGDTEFDKEIPATFLNEDYCAIENQHFFVRGIIHLPIIGSAETFCWGVWGSLSRENFETLLRGADEPERVELPEMFSWLSNQIDGYPDTLSLKMYAQIQEPASRPIFELEPTDHPLAQEYHYGITAERVREIMASRLEGE